MKLYEFLTRNLDGAEKELVLEIKKEPITATRQSKA